MVLKASFPYTFFILITFKSMQFEDSSEESEEEISSESQEENPELQEIGSRNRFYLTQVKFLLVLTYMCLGATRYVPGPTMVDLSIQVHEDLPDLPLIFTARSAGYILGCIAGPFALKFLHFYQKTILLFMLMILLSATMFTITQIRDIGFLYTAFFASGIWMAGIIAGVNEIHFTLYANLNMTFFKALAAFYSLGALTSPFLARGYVNNSINKTHLSPHINVPQHFSSIKFVYVLLFLMSLLVSLLWLANYCFMVTNNIQVHKPEPRKQELDPILKFFAIFNASILNFVIVTLNFSFPQLLPTYGILAFNMTQYEVCNLLILFHGFYALGSILLFLKPRFINPYNFQVVGIALVFCGAMLLYLYKNIDFTSFWVGNAFIGLGSSPLLPTLLIWLGSKLTLNHNIVLPLLITGALSEMVVPTAMAHYIFNYARLSTSYLFVTCVYVIFMLFQFLWMHLLIPRREEKNTHPTQDVDLEEHFIRRYFRRLSQDYVEPLFNKKRPAEPKQNPAEPDKIFIHINEALTRASAQRSELVLSLRQMENLPTAVPSKSEPNL